MGQHRIQLLDEASGWVVAGCSIPPWGWQGERRMQVVFALDLETALDGANLGRHIQRIGIADGFYLAGPAEALADRWEDFEASLDTHGHRLRRTKCQVCSVLPDA